MSITIHLTGPMGTLPGQATALAIFAKPGQSLMQAASAANVPGIAADCGGCLTCATCHVFVQEPWASTLKAPSPEETAMLDMTATPREATSRLSCQLLLTSAMDGLEVRLPQLQY